ncbi:uncharacterized protein LOC126591136 isoform X2 [Malus sylvestris]|uniref:uncharacterized protein LOC126591136 isoform X2 n=1 Tax=Malus sylvestris TaxID=3752 RepID=UPI0021ACFAB2|nr:uncharacterized protein LOC126591136 isoform X2 [Malus sylvestris]
MAQLERPQRHGDSESTIIHEPRKLTATQSPTMEQYLRGGEVLRSTSSPSSTSSSSPVGHHDGEEDHGHHHKKSVLTKVKEKAKKLKHSLSNKKKHSEGDNSTPTWGASPVEHEDEEQDAEYLGAPMYESEMAPEGYKETAKLQPRAVPVISEKHVLPSSVTPGFEHDKEKPPSPNKTVTKIACAKPLSPREVITGTVATKPCSPKEAVTGTVATKPADSPSKSTEIAKTSSPNKTIAETVTEKLGPAYATVSDTTYAIASKIEGLTVSAPAAVSNATHAIASKVGLAVAAPTPSDKSPEAPHTVSASSALQNSSSRATPQILAASEGPQPLSVPAAPQSGEDERALSQVISDAMSPKKASGGGDVGMVGKVKGAINSMLWNEEPSETTTAQSAVATSPNSQSAMMTSSPRIPVSTNAHEAIEEEKKGRILQTN